MTHMTPRQKHILIDLPNDPSPFWSSMRRGMLRMSAPVETTRDTRASATPLWEVAYNSLKDKDKNSIVSSSAYNSLKDSYLLKGMS